MANGNLLFDSGNSNQGPVTTKRGEKGLEVGCGKEVKEGGIYVHLWLIHVMYGRNETNIVKQLSFN